jgi:hypothetical protein
LALSTDGRNERLSDLAADWTVMSLHTADPGTTGANEVVGGAPAYERQSVTWGVPSGGAVSLSNQPVFPVPASITVSHVGFWKGSVFQGGFALSVAQPFINQGTLTIDSYTISQPAA